MTTDERLDEISTRLNNIEVRFNNMDGRLNNIENRFTHPQLRQQLDRIENGGKLNFFYSSLAVSIAAMIFATNLLGLLVNQTTGIIVGVLGLLLLIWSSYNLLQAMKKPRDG